MAVKQSLVTPTGMRDVSAKGQAEARSYAYWTTGCLQHAVLDGFYMTDDQFPEICDEHRFPKLEQLLKFSVAEHDPREVVYVDLSQDPTLIQLRDRAREAVNACAHQQQGAAAQSDTELQIQALATIVSEHFGGSFDNDDSLAHAWRQTSSSQKKVNGSVVIPLGMLGGGGVSRHRALLFKVLADSQSIKCQLLRGLNLGCNIPNEVAKIQVEVAGKPCILDLVHEPGRLVPCDQPQDHGPCVLSVRDSNIHVSATLPILPIGCVRPKALSESQLAMPDLIRLDSGHVAETADCSCAKFPSPSPAMAGSASEPPGATAAPAPAGCAPVPGPSSNGHSHSRSFDVSALTAAGFSSHVDLQRPSHSPDHPSQEGWSTCLFQQPNPTFSSPLANAAGSQAGVPPQPSSQQPSSRPSSQPGTPPPAAAAPLPHWGLVNNQPRPTPQAQGPSAFFPSAGQGLPPTANSHMGGAAMPPPALEPKLMQQQQQQQQLGNGLKPNVAKNFSANAKEPFADLSPFKSVPLLAASVPISSLNQQKPPQPLQQQAAGVGAAPAHAPTPRRHTDTPLVPDAGAGLSQQTAMQQPQQQFGNRAKTRINGSASSPDMVALGAGPGHPGAAPPHQPGLSGSPPAADGASLAAPQPGGKRHVSPFAAAVTDFDGMGHDDSQNMAKQPWVNGSGAATAAAGPGPGAASGQAQRHSQLPPPPSPHGGLAPGEVQHEEQQQQQAVPGTEALGHPGPGLRQDELVSRMPSLHLGHDKDWKICPSQLEQKTCIGQGSYGQVFIGEWLMTVVAIKRLYGTALSETAVKEFKTEVSIMHTLKHPNIVMFMGAVVQPDQLSIVTQYIPRGNLFNLLHLCPKCHRKECEVIVPKRRLAFARDIALGMLYLHSRSPPIVHRDLKSANLLVDLDWTVKVCDFGLSQVKHAAYLSVKPETLAGTVEWMAPEALRSEACTEKCDLYSFGVILYELVTGERPWSQCRKLCEMGPCRVILMVGCKKQRLELPNDLQPKVKQLVEACWSEDPTKRPSFVEVLDRLTDLRDEGLVPSPSRMALSRDKDLAKCCGHTEEEQLR